MSVFLGFSIVPGGDLLILAKFTQVFIDLLVFLLIFTGLDSFAQNSINLIRRNWSIRFINGLYLLFFQIPKIYLFFKPRLV